MVTNLSSVKNSLKALGSRVYQEINPRIQREIADRFLRFYYDEAISGPVGKTWKNTYWLGVPILKCPFDMWVYQEILFELKPDIIIECGTAYGGSAFYLASMCDLIGHGHVITIDVDNTPTTRKEHQRITYLLGSSTSEDIVDRVKSFVVGKERILAILDSDHSKAHVLEEMRIYSHMVTIGSYMIVEDTMINGHPALPDFGPGPMEALDEFMLENHDFEIDTTREKFHVSFNPRGYLKKVR